MGAYRRVIILAGAGIVVVLAALLLRRQGGTETAIQEATQAGWPDKISMTCKACSKTYELPTSQYLAAMKSQAGDKAAIKCPSCGSPDVVRTDNLKNDRSNRTRAEPKQTPQTND